MANIANIIGKLSGIISSLDDIKTAILNGGGGGSVTASNVSVVPTSPFVSTNLQNLSVEEANAISANAGDITTINTALGNTSISGIGDGSVTGAIATNNSNINTINTALGNTSISGIGDGSVTGAISTLNSSNIHRSFINDVAEYNVNITSYQSSYYTIPKDGYVMIGANTGSIQLSIGRSGWIALNANPNTGYNAIFVQKGQEVKVGVSGDGTAYYRA